MVCASRTIAESMGTFIRERRANGFVCSSNQFLKDSLAIAKYHSDLVHHSRRVEKRSCESADYTVDITETLYKLPETLGVCKLFSVMVVQNAKNH